MPILTMPVSPGFRDSDFGKESNTRPFRSELSFAVQTHENPGPRWFARYSLPPMTRAQAALWQSFLVQLNGQSGRFYGYDPDAKTPQGSSLGTGLVNGADQSGKTLITDGWNASQATLFKEGDYIAYDTSIGRELRMITADASSDGSGNATLSLDAPIMNAPADNASIISSSASCIMMLEENRVNWNANDISIYGITFSAVEVFRG